MSQMLLCAAMRVWTSTALVWIASPTMLAAAAEPDPCRVGENALYDGTCLGSEHEAVCKDLRRFFELVTYSREAMICKPEEIEATVRSQVDNAARLTKQAPAGAKNAPETTGLVKNVKLDMVKGFLSPSLEKAEPDASLHFKVKPGKAAEFKKLRDAALKDAER